MRPPLTRCLMAYVQRLEQFVVQPLGGPGDQFCLERYKKSRLAAHPSLASGVGTAIH